MLIAIIWWLLTSTILFISLVWFISNIITSLNNDEIDFGHILHDKGCLFYFLATGIFNSILYFWKFSKLKFFFCFAQLKSKQSKKIFYLNARISQMIMNFLFLVYTIVFYTFTFLSLSSMRMHLAGENNKIVY